MPHPPQLCPIASPRGPGRNAVIPTGGLSENYSQAGKDSIWVFVCATSTHRAILAGQGPRNRRKLPQVRLPSISHRIPLLLNSSVTQNSFFLHNTAHPHILHKGPISPCLNPSSQFSKDTKPSLLPNSQPPFSRPISVTIKCSSDCTIPQGNMHPKTHTRIPYVE